MENSVTYKVDLEENAPRAYRLSVADETYSALREIVHNGKRNFKHIDESDDYYRAVDDVFEHLSGIIGDINFENQ